MWTEGDMHINHTSVYGGLHTLLELTFRTFFPLKDQESVGKEALLKGMARE